MNYLNGLTSGGLGGDSTLQLNNVEVLYSKVQKVYVKPQQKEERQRDLRVNVEVHAGISPVCRKSLCVSLSDDDDPCFLYSLIVTEDDFKVLKAQQGLLVDFDNFATQLICLLEQCHVPVTSLTKNPPRFLLLLAEEAAEWTVKLVETNNFKHLCHLCLNIVSASDSDLKTHMAVKIKQLKESILQKDRSSHNLETRLNELTTKLEAKMKELEQVEQKHLSDKNQMQLSLSQQVGVEKDRLAQAKLEWQRQSERERVDTEQRHTETLKQLHTELAELRTQNATYKEQLALLEVTNKEQSKQLQNLEKDLNATQRDLALLKKQNSKLDVDYHDKDKAVNSLRTKVAVLEQEVKDKGILLSRQTEMLKTVKEQKQQLEDLIADKEGQLQRKQNSLRNLSDELVKANEILTKLQNELASTKSKLKLRTSIALEQERLLDSKQKEVGQLECKVESLTKETAEAKAEMEDLREQVKALQQQIEEKERIMKNNDNVISWLNRKLADNQSPLQTATAGGGPAAGPMSVQLTLPRTNKLFPNRFESRTPAPNVMQTSALSGLSLRNPVVQNPNINQTVRSNTARTMGVGVADNTMGLTSFNKAGQISSTSTPMERINNFNKIPGSGPCASAMPPIIENNNSPVNKAKTANTAMQGGLRRAGLSDKPILPSAYFPKTLH